MIATDTAAGTQVRTADGTTGRTKGAPVLTSSGYVVKVAYDAPYAHLTAGGGADYRLEALEVVTAEGAAALGAEDVAAALDAAGFTGGFQVSADADGRPVVRTTAPRRAVAAQAAAAMEKALCTRYDIVTFEPRTGAAFTLTFLAQR